MNVKAEKFNEMLKIEKIEAFEVQELEDEYHTVLFRSHLEIQGQMLPFLFLVDDSVYGILRTVVGQNVIRDENFQEVEQYLMELNAKYKAFKYYITVDNSLLMDCSLPADDESFQPNLVRALLNPIIQHLQDEYAGIMKKIWGNETKADKIS